MLLTSPAGPRPRQPTATRTGLGRASSLIAVSRGDKKLARAKELGAVHTVKAGEVLESMNTFGTVGVAVINEF